MRIFVLMAVGTLLGACETTITPEAATTDFRNTALSDGRNPFLDHPSLRQIEGDLYRYISAPSDSLKMEQMVARAAPDIGMARLNQTVASMDQGAEALIAARYGAPAAPGTPCSVQPSAGAPFTDTAFSPIAWQFEAGACVNGRVEGIASVHSIDGQYRFTGVFSGGRAMAGIFQQPAAKLVYDGPMPQGEEAVGGALFHHKPGKLPYYYVGSLARGKLNGRGIVAWRDNAGRLQVTFAGGFVDNLLQGYGAKREVMTFAGDGRKWGVWYGNWDRGKPHGVAAWTNDGDSLFVGTYNRGVREGAGGNYFYDLTDAWGLYRSFRFGNYIDGKRHGRFLVANAMSGAQDGETWNRGSLVEDSSDFDFGQVFALAAGMALVASAEIPDAARLELGSAYVADVLGNTGGSNIRGAAASAAERGRPAAAAPSSPAAGGMRYESYTFSCAHGGTYTIDVPYREAAKLGVKKDFAKTMSCNEIDNWSAVQDRCQSAFGNRTCEES